MGPLGVHPGRQRMKRFVVAVAAVLVVAWIGCGKDGGGGGGNHDAGPPQDKAWVRFANLSPDTPPMDICIKQSSSQDWGTPVLAKNGLAGGLTYPAMTHIVFI